jgi:hypothetical protein
MSLKGFCQDGVVGGAGGDECSGTGFGRIKNTPAAPFKGHTRGCWAHRVLKKGYGGFRRWGSP